jgi:voltage-gated potassium channel
MPIWLALFSRTRVLVSRLGLLILLAVIVLAGAAAFAAVDHTTFGTALYWAVTTASTVGYGDVTPSTGAGRLVAVGVMLTAIPALGLVFANATSAASELRVRRLLGIGGGRRLDGHMLILGWNARAAVAARELLRAGYRVLVVADAPSRPLDDPGAEWLRADPLDEAALAGAGPERARGAIVCLERDGDTLIAVIALRHLAPALPLSCVTQSERTRAALADLGVAATLAVDDLVGHALAKSVEAPHAGELLLRLVDSAQFRVREQTVTGEDAGATVRSLRERSRLPLVLGVVQNGQVRIGVAEEAILGVGDSLLVLEPVTGDGR